MFPHPPPYLYPSTSSHPGTSSSSKIVVHKSGSFMSVVDTKRWQGGRITETSHNVHVDMLSSSIISQPRRNVGGRQPTKDKNLDGLNSGVPTRTTATLTTTTLRNFERTFQECQPEPTHQNQARFVPPLVQPSTQVVHKSGSFMSVVDTKSWQGGRITETSHNVHVDMLSSSIISQPRRNVGGRRPTKDKNISPEEEKKRAVRRERNRLAAARFRKKRLDYKNKLILESERLEEQNKFLENEIQQLQKEKSELGYLLENHQPCFYKVSDPSLKDSVEGKEYEAGNITKTPLTKKNNRQWLTTLSVPSYLSAQVDGVPRATPTIGMTFNFDSLMEGGTGLTPVSEPPTPSFATQQRNSGCVDLSSPDSSNLLSL